MAITSPPAVLNTGPIEVAVVGGGIVGMALALGLLQRGIRVRIWEQSRNVREIGAGLAFTANAVSCMRLLNPAVVDALRSVATTNGDEEYPNDYLRWVDGYHQDAKDPRHEELLFTLYAGVRGFEGCHRAHLLEALTKALPEGTITFNKRLRQIHEGQIDGKIALEFTDGTFTKTDAVIGCDGIKSHVRRYLLGRNNPASYAHYTHKVAYRALIPMEKAVEKLGSYKAKNQHMHVGPKSHLLHFPVANQTLMNVVAFDTDPEEWRHEATVAPANHDDVEKVFACWGPTVRDIVSMFPAQLDKWAVFDTYDHPVPFYSRGQICLTGDAAHAAAPHHGAGAGCGIEDALCLADLMERAVTAMQTGRLSKVEALSTAFSVYSNVRYQRSQWLVKTSHEVCEIYEWNDAETGQDADKCFQEIKQRSHKIWHFDYEGMLAEAAAKFEMRVPRGILSEKSAELVLTAEIDEGIDMQEAQPFASIAA